MKKKLFTRRRILRLGVYGGGAVTLDYTALVEPFWRGLVERKLPIARLLTSLKGKNLVQISDIHVSSRVSTNYLIRKLAARCSALLRLTRTSWSIPETSFLWTKGRTPAWQLCSLISPQGGLERRPFGESRLRGELGAREVGAEIIRALNAQGIPILRNEVRDIGGLQVLGLDDSWAEKIDLAKGRGG